MELFMKDVNVFIKLLNPLNKLCGSLSNEYIELTSEECFCEFKNALKLTWENVHFHINTYHNEKFNSFLHISNTLTSVVFSEHKLSSWKLYEDFLKKHNLIKPCISILMIESFKNHIFSANECTDLFFKEFEKSNTFNIFLLIIHQIEVCLEILLKILSNEREEDILLKESRKYVLNRLVWCLNFFSNPSNNLLFNEQPQPGSFMQLMDNALDIIYEIDVETKQEKCFETLNISKAYIDELLSHAMSIAQITLSEECINIKAGSQKVLNEFEQLNFECRTEIRNIPLCNLLIDSVSYALCSLEQRVNVGVLKLLLEVFKNYDEHLLNLKNYCVISKKVSRSVDDLDDLILSFDLQIDRIMHIGLFAVACSTNKHRVLKMRSCLASLESLESELVPAITTYYLEQTIETRTHAEVLIQHWYDMINTLQDLIHLIVDPVAFTQVVLNSCKDDLEKFESEKNNGKQNLSDLDNICNKCTLLIRHLNLCIPEIYESIPNNIKGEKDLIYDLLHECKSAKKVLLDDNSINPISDICYQRIIKRFKILIKYLRKFHAALTESEEIKQVSNETIPKLSKTKIDNMLQAEAKPENGKTVGALALLMLRGEILRKERSILYQTPKKTPMKPLTPYHKLSGKPKNVSTSISFARKLSKISSSFLEDTEINFTALLKDVTANLESTKF